MQQEEDVELATCAGCGAEIALASDRAFSFGSGSALCWECSLKRGGRYDAAHERWEVDPRVSDLPAEDS